MLLGLRRNKMGSHFISTFHTVRGQMWNNEYLTSTTLFIDDTIFDEHFTEPHAAKKPTTTASSKLTTARKPTIASSSTTTINMATTTTSSATKTTSRATRTASKSTTAISRSTTSTNRPTKTVSRPTATAIRLTTTTVSSPTRTQPTSTARPTTTRAIMPTRTQPTTTAGPTRTEPTTTKSTTASFHKVKDDTNITQINKLIQQQTRKMFNSMKKEMKDNKMRKEVDSFLTVYEDKFGEFVKATGNKEIRNHGDRQEVILNIIELSNSILNRVINNFTMHKEKPGESTDFIFTVNNLFQKQLANKVQLENRYICNTYKICRRHTGFTDFLLEILSIILSADDDRVKEIGTALTRIFKSKNNDYRFTDSEGERRFLNGMANLDKLEGSTIKMALNLIRNGLVFRTSPIEVLGDEICRKDKTKAFRVVLNTLDRILPPSKSNILQWIRISNNFNDWKELRRRDTIGVVYSFLDYIMKPILLLRDADKIIFFRNVHILLGIKKKQ